jgi:hypothetical protein
MKVVNLNMIARQGNNYHAMSDNTGQGLTYTISSSHDKVNPNASAEEGAI